ncbi:hypothetical protein ACEQPO_21010 [Bacillus sp. SL00103]
MGRLDTLSFQLTPHSHTLIGVGYTDDLGAITFALLQVAMYIDDDVKGKAKDRLSKMVR